MRSRYTRALAALTATGAIAVPAVAQARGGSDDPPNHEQREHQVEHHRHHDRSAFVRHDRRRDRPDNDRRDRRGDDDGPGHH